MNIFSKKAEGASSFIPEEPVNPAASGGRIHCGTDQQEALWSALAHDKFHVLAEARAGCGKSSSCREGMWRMLERHSDQRIRYSVFNKANADEFRGACPPGVDVATSHSFGFSALKNAFRSQVDKLKTYLCLDETPRGKQLPRYMRKSIAMLVGHAKNNALDPQTENEVLLKQLTDLALHYDVNVYGKPGLIAGWAADILSKSAEWTEIVDFDDMLWLPGLHRITLPPCDVLFLDEVQDFNPAQQKLALLACGEAGRVVAVGDRYQAVNIFRGADEESIPNLSAHLQDTQRGLHDFPLTITFRCPKSHVALANSYVTDLRAHDSAPEGEVQYNVSLDDMLSQTRPGHLVICPTNAPVIKGCLKMIGLKRPAYVRGRAVGDQLVSIVRGAGQAKTVPELARAVESWRSKELNRVALMDGVEDVIESVNDRANGLQAVLSVCDSPNDAETLIGQLFSDDRRSNVVTFSTIHRAKGDEADSVWYIEAPTRQAKRPWEARQQDNLRYVGLTRSKRRLVFVQPPAKLRDEEEF